ncbi:MAG: 4Fe-4S dicluster domain-containing protein, partial [Clostridia bacterium]|nr:4Fe-4S dicluster domain-containing protein [Clostridia bacterium]
LTEHRISREKVYIIGIPCDGMLDASALRALAPDGISRAERTVEPTGDMLTLHTLYDGDITVPYSDALPERCQNCKSKKIVVFDEISGEGGDVTDAHRFDGVTALEAMTEDERFAFWQGELSRCIRCNACRDVCPACTCETCVFDNPKSGMESKAPSDSFEEKMFHIIRAFHVAGRCTDCGECSRVCPQHIPLHLLNRKFIYDIDRSYGSYMAGAEEGTRSPLVSYSTDDPEPADITGGDRG